MAGRERRYELPGIEDLTKEQERVLALPRAASAGGGASSGGGGGGAGAGGGPALPSKGRYLIVGGPGTGKTVVCLLRARRHARSGEDYVFLVWNHLLHRASRALFRADLTAETWQSWFWREFRRLVGRSVPTLEADAGGWRREDWDAVARSMDDLPRLGNGTPDFPFLVIDEGQDMPPGFYDFLNNVGFANIFVAADQNQQIKDENSSRRELEERLGGEVLELTKNHRNRRPIARLARAFYTGDPASPPPDLPPEAGTAYVPRLYLVNEAAMPRIASSVLRHWDQDPGRLVGVIAPNNAVREKYLQELKRVRETVSLDNGRPEIETFHRQRMPEVRFDRGGILVINAQACKGLEFETVVLADIDRHIVDAGDPDRTKKLFYVMVSRARRRVVLFMKKSGSREVDELLPSDENVLRREDLTGD